MSIPKNNGDKRIGEKTITETASQLPGVAIMFELAPTSANLVRLANSTATKKFLKEIAEPVELKE